MAPDSLQFGDNRRGSEEKDKLFGDTKGERVRHHFLVKHTPYHLHDVVWRVLEAFESGMLQVEAGESAHTMRQKVLRAVEPDIEKREGAGGCTS